MPDNDEKKNPTEAMSVTDRVLTAFIEALLTDDAYKDIAARLNETLLVKRNFTEAALRSALFDGDAS
jgi:hypothetical protein